MLKLPLLLLPLRRRCMCLEGSHELLGSSAAPQAENIVCTCPGTEHCILATSLLWNGAAARACLAATLRTQQCSCLAEVLHAIEISDVQYLGIRRATSLVIGGAAAEALRHGHGVGIGGVATHSGVAAM
jgi:hypothetical protein